MNVEIRVPDTLGEGVSKAKVTEWLRAEGDAVDLDEPLLVIETEKTSIEVESTAAGRVLTRSAEVGDLVDPGQVVAVVEAS